MTALKSVDVDDLARRFFSGEGGVDGVAEQYSRAELCDFLRSGVEGLEEIVSGMTPAQLAYRLSGKPEGPDQSGDEGHFDTSEIVTHVATGLAFHWWGLTRALKHERPEFPRPPEGSTSTGKLKNGMGAGGWSGVPAPELLTLLRDMSGRFLAYVEALPADIDMSPTARWTTFGNVTAHGWLFLAAIHPMMHLNQIKRMQAREDYPAG